jgi:hypothetical protein
MNTVGYNVYAHFCGNDLKATSLIVETESCCGDDEDANGMMQDEEGCCTEEIKQVIIKDDYLKVATEKVNTPVVLCLFILPVHHIYSVETNLVSVNEYTDTSPPGRKVPISIAFQIFRI